MSLSLIKYPSGGSGGGGSVTSVAATIPVGAISITGSPITTSGILAFSYLGGANQYMAGDGSLVTFPTIFTTSPNLLIAATNSSGNIVDGSSNVVTRPITSYVVGANTALVDTDTILQAFGKVQGQINTRVQLTSPITGYAIGSNTAIVATDTILQAFGKAQGQVAARITLISVLTGFTTGANSTILATDTLTQGLGKAQGQINARVVGPASATDEAIVRYDAATGKLVQNSSVTINDTGNIIGIAGTQAAPSYSFTGGTNSGLYFAAGAVELSIGGTNKASFGAANTFLTGPVFNHTDGTAANPSYTFQTDGDTGIYKAGLGTLGFSTDGVARLSIDGTGAWLLAGSTAGVSGQSITSNGAGTSPTWQNVLLEANFRGGQSLFVANNVITVFDIVHNLGSIPSYFSLSTTEPISQEHLTRTITFPDNNTMRLTFGLAPLTGSNANYVWIVYR